MKQYCTFLQMYLCRIRFRETISKIRFNMSTICINYQLKTFRKSLTQVTNDFLEDLARSFRSLTFRAFKLWRWTVETLLSRYDQIPKFRGFRSGEDRGPFLFGYEVRNIHWKSLLSLFDPMWCAESCWKNQGRFLKCSRAQGNTAPTRMSSQ